MSVERIDKLLASQGTKSRSDVKKLIKSGAVTVNGEKIKDFSVKINPEKEEVCIYGKPVSIAGYVYLMMNKPAGVVCATRDKKEKTVIDIIPEEFRRKDIFPVGRLDKDTEGLLIITNDGEFAHKVTSPEKNIYKTYHAVTDSSINASDIEAFEEEGKLPSSISSIVTLGSDMRLYFKKLPDKTPSTGGYVFDDISRAYVETNEG